MVASCSAYNCTQRYTKGVTFHGFPKDVELRRKWIQVVRRDGFTPSKQSKLCGKHFTSDCYNESPWSSQKKLKNDVIPSIFDFPTHLRKISNPRKPSKNRQNIISDNITTDLIKNNSVDNYIINVDSNITNDSIQKIDIEKCQINPTTNGKRYIGDFDENDIITPENSKKFLKLTISKLAVKQKTIKMLQQSKRHLIKRIKDLHSFLSHLKSKSMISEEISTTLMGTMSESTKQLFCWILQGKNKKHYPPELRSFALTLNFYSAKAYSYVRKTFNNALPHPRTIQKWYKSVDCSLGFSKEALVTLHNKVKEAQKIDQSVVCSLMLDEMAIRKKIEWTGHKFSGYVDFGADISNDNLPEAKEALVFMVNCVNGRWKLPVAYFLIDGLGGYEKANIVKCCLQFIYESGVEVISLTFDGIASNISMASFLGSNTSIENMKTWFPHPISHRPIHILPDPPHMLKLIRNTLASRPAIYDTNGNSIEWSYLQKLVDIQNSKGLHIATKIRNRHIDWTQEKMKVKVAAQSFSLSVAKALKYLKQTTL